MRGTTFLSVFGEKAVDAGEGIFIFSSSERRFLEETQKNYIFFSKSLAMRPVSITLAKPKRGVEQPGSSSGS